MSLEHRSVDVIGLWQYSDGPVHGVLLLLLYQFVSRRGVLVVLILGLCVRAFSLDPIVWQQLSPNDLRHVSAT